jgi:hypothetical protein
MISHLIAHKYCGQPTIDIATQMSNGVWILNDGHIAYPYWSMPIPLSIYMGQIKLALGQTVVDVPIMPDDARDAYPEPRKEPAEKPQALRGLLTKIGLLPKLERRL